MIVDKINREVEVDNLGFEDTSNRIELDADVMGEVLDILSKQMYKDKFGSIVREIGSNSDDSHIEAGVNKPIIVEYRHIEGEYYLCFIDEGMGISPSRWKDSFSKYLKSTKSKDNNQTGGFGLGSKSPFSYTDIYYVDTIYERVKYNYIMYKDENGYPHEECLNKTETTKHNGTELRFIVEGGYWSNDYHEFKEAIVEQLTYFENVYVKNIHGFNNEFQIYKGKYFKYRLDTQLTEMHIAFGKVKYPIEWKRLGMNQINIPVGITIPIGSVDVIRSREGLQYTDKTKEEVKKAIENAMNELRGYVSGNCETIDEYIKRKKDKTDKLNIYINDKVIINVGLGNYGNTKDGTRIVYPFNIPSLYFKAFKDTPINIPTDNPYFPFKVKSTISKGRILTKEKEENYNIWKLLHPEEDGRRTTRFVPTLYRTNKFINDKYKNYSIQEGLLIEKRAIKLNTIGATIGLGKHSTSGFIKFLAKQEEENAPLFIGPLEREGTKRPKVGLRVVNKIKGEPLIGEWGNKTKLIQLYKKEITKEIVRVSESYDKYEVTAYQMQQYDDLIRSRRVIQTRNVESIYATDLFKGISAPKEEFKYEELSKGTGFIIYGDNSLKEQLKTIQTILIKRTRHREADYIKYKNRKIYFEVFKILMVNKTDIKRMEELENAYNIEDFMSKHKTFKQEATKALVYPYFKDVYIDSLVKKLCSPIKKLYEEVNSNSLTSYEYDNLNKSKLGKEMIYLIELNEWYDKDMVNKAKALVEISNNLTVFRAIKSNYELSKNLTFDEEKMLSALIIRAGYIPDLIYSLKLSEDEVKWMEEGENLAKYYIDINTISLSTNKITKIVKEEAWKSYPKLRSPNKSAKISMSLLEMKTTQ